jgi:hypothetical protein
MKGIPTVAWIVAGVIIVLVLVPLLTGKSAITIATGGMTSPAVNA